jgi:glycosyltransferase involved in cell wall biosynthesis
LRFFEPHTTSALIKLIRGRRFDIVQTSLFFANLHGRVAARIAGTPRIFSEEHNIYPWKDRHPVFKMSDRLLSGFSERIIACSDSVSKATARQEGIRLDKFYTIHNCIDFSKFDINRTKDELRAEYGFDSKEKLLGTVGALSEQKGHNYLLDALKIMLAKNDKCTLLVVGDGPLKNDLEAQADRLGISENVRFMGCRRDVARILKTLDVFVLPSVWEGFGIAVLEAMYSGLPVVASCVDGIPEVVVDGRTGILVGAKNPAGLADGICNILQNPDMAAGMGQAGKDRVVERFSPQRYVSKLEALWQT